jgi:hypothetical protein
MATSTMNRCPPRLQWDLEVGQSILVNFARLRLAARLAFLGLAGLARPCRTSLGYASLRAPAALAASYWTKLPPC